MKQEYIDNAEKYKYLNSNKADIGYAKNMKKRQKEIRQWIWEQKSLIN